MLPLHAGFRVRSDNHSTQAVDPGQALLIAKSTPFELSHTNSQHSSAETGRRHADDNCSLSLDDLTQFEDGSAREPAVIVLSVEKCEIIKGGIGDALPDTLLFEPNEDSRALVKTITEQLTLCAGNGNSFLTAKADRLTELLLIEVMEQFLKAHPIRSRLLQGIFDRGLSKSLKAVHANPEYKWTVSELASIANMSRSQFAEKFRHSLNETPFNYVRQCRVQKAKLLLAESLSSMEQIAQECGYASQSSFIKTFAAMTGHSPGEWRSKKVRKNEQQRQPAEEAAAMQITAPGFTTS